MFISQTPRTTLLKRKLSISFESFRQVQKIVADFSPDSSVVFLTGGDDGENFYIASSDSQQIHEFTDRRFDRPKTKVGIDFAPCDGEHDPHIEDAIARYIREVLELVGQVRIIYRVSKIGTESRVVALALLRDGDEQVDIAQSHRDGSEKSFEILSVFDAVVYVCLQYCAASRQSDTFFGLAPDILARSAGQLLLQNICKRASGRSNYAFYEICCDIAASQYEGRSGAGYIILASRKELGQAPIIKFRRPIHLSHPTGVRKLIEMASQQFALLFDGDYFYGFADYAKLEQPYHIRFAGRGIWAIHKGDAAVALISYGTPVESERVLTKTAFQDHIRRTLPMITPEGLERVWEIATVACEQPVGTNILFTPGAPQEALRLSSQCIPIDPVALTPDVTPQLTAIDGTVIADTEGFVHAVGAIMDGGSTPNGTWQRGGRYNSAANYVTSSQYPAVIFIVSQDGYVDIVPPLDAKGSKWTMRRYLKLSSTAI